MPEQAALYARIVDELRTDLKVLPKESKQRRGAVLTALLKLKQICTHPALLTGDEHFDPRLSGKMQRLASLVEEIAQRQERVIIFSQFRPMTEVLCQFVGHIFGHPGLLLHGDTPVGERQHLVEDFQREDGPPFFVLSLKAGGTGLTLTAASHVVHFDRWWNPAVEDQATDRAFRIGQKRNVLVHKFNCLGTIEAKIATLLEDKRSLSKELLPGPSDSEINLTSLADDELLQLITLDLNQVAEKTDLVNEREG